MSNLVASILVPVAKYMPSDSDSPKLSIAAQAAPGSVPTFPCIVYVSKEPGGGVNARVANLEGIRADGNNERDALGKIIPAFKQLVSELMTNGQTIPWVDPLPDLNPDEQKRFIPVHL